MDLNLLTTFLSVYNRKSITLAAEELKISQPAVSAALKRLENSLGKPLFVRDGRGIAPTSFSVALAKKISHPLSILEGVGQQTGHVKLYCTELLLHKIACIEAIDIAATPVSEQEIIDNMVMQKVDLVIDVMRNNFSALVSEEIYEEEAVCLARIGHPRIGDTINEEQYYKEQHIAWRFRRDNLNTLEFLAEQPVKERQVKVETESISSMLSLASRTDYIASAPRSIAEELAPQFGLNIYEYPIKLKPAKINMIYHRRHINDPFHKNIRETIKHSLSKNLGSSRLRA